MLVCLPRVARASSTAAFSFREYVGVDFVKVPAQRRESLLPIQQSGLSLAASGSFMTNHFWSPVSVYVKLSHGHWYQTNQYGTQEKFNRFVPGYSVRCRISPSFLLIDSGEQFCRI